MTPQLQLESVRRWGGTDLRPWMQFVARCVPKLNRTSLFPSLWSRTASMTSVCLFISPFLLRLVQVWDTIHNSAMAESKMAATEYTMQFSFISENVQGNKLSFLLLWKSESMQHLHIVTSASVSNRHMKQFLRKHWTFFPQTDSSDMFMHSVLTCKCWPHCHLFKCHLSICSLPAYFLGHTVTKHVWQDVPGNMLHVLSPNGSQGRNLGKIKIKTNSLSGSWRWCWSWRWWWRRCLLDTRPWQRWILCVKIKTNKKFNNKIHYIYFERVLLPPCCVVWGQQWGCCLQRPTPFMEHFTHLKVCGGMGWCAFSSIFLTFAVWNHTHTK